MQTKTFLTRTEFREGVFQRDGHKCVVCERGDCHLDSHHIIERRLWGVSEGYYIDNGATLCEVHHREAESTVLSCEELRRLCGIKNIILPEHLYPDEEWDKWGNLILPNGMRMIGELFFDESVQRILQPVLHLFTNRVKYPRTYHLPWSPGFTKDDRVHTQESLKVLKGSEVVVTVKMDGENTTFYQDGLHARSLDYHAHESRNRVRALQAQVGFDIPKDWRVCGENLYATHSIHYENLPHYFLMFSLWTDRNLCLSWDETKEWAELMGLKMVPELYRGPWDEAHIKSLFKPAFQNNPMEGYVVRVTREFSYREFRDCVGKFVRPDHVQTHGGHMRQRVVPNGLEDL